MLYIPCLLAVVVATLGLVTNSTVSTEVNLPIPRIYGISHETSGPVIHWSLEDSEDEAVLGYKVKLWEVGCVTKLKHKTVNGETVAVRERVMPRLRDYSTLRNLKEFTQEGVNNSSFFMKNIEHSTDVPYLIRVSAYSASGEGPLSLPLRFQVMGGYKCT
ncbi:uncharacterized protein [Epargyreus clarus]|uniref:uncharacterized protein n=1 Tax=Epargyreus clarus TaxID=520877 RepID=UPI003C30974B